MQRHTTTPRTDWQQIVESQGFHFHSLDAEGEPTPYWDESAYYAFTSRQVDEIERATYALADMALKAVEHVLQEDMLDLFGIPPSFAAFIQQSWEQDEQSVYGRFDLVYDGHMPPKMLEYNADTPTGLLEAAVIQWYWLKDKFGSRDQFNSIHERLIEVWKLLGMQSRDRWYFTSLGGHVEDFMTVQYLRDTAMQAGMETDYIAIEKIGWNDRRGAFVDAADQPMTRIFKLYPWEWLLHERFGAQLLKRRARWMEPAWKMILSNKAILPVMHELFPESPYLLPASWEPMGTTYVQKPILGREGANIRIVRHGDVVHETTGMYDKSPSIYQEYRALPCYSGRYPIIGSWFVNGYACGIGIREDATPITTNCSRFVPHLIQN